jgi:hypothetical protein
MPKTTSDPDRAHTDPITALKQGIDELASSDLSDIDRLNRDLSANLQKLSENKYYATWHSETGAFAGVATKSIELRVQNKDASQALLVIKLAEPGPEAETFVRRFWPNAEFTPSSPHGADSPSYWLVKQGNGLVSINHPHEDGRIMGISFDHMP